MQQVTERLDRLILRIKEIQQPYMDGQKPVDILLVRSLFASASFFSVSLSFCFLPPASPMAANGRELQVSHGLTLRCFVKRWLGFSVGATSPLLMLAPGAIAVLRYVLPC